MATTAYVDHSRLQFRRYLDSLPAPYKTYSALNQLPVTEITLVRGKPI